MRPLQYKTMCLNKNSFSCFKSAVGRLLSIEQSANDLIKYFLASTWLPISD